MVLLKVGVYLKCSSIDTAAMYLMVCVKKKCCMIECDDFRLCIKCVLGICAEGLGPVLSEDWNQIN